jgi:hypothetical protein
LFTYGLEQFIQLHARERRREIDDIARRRLLTVRRRKPLSDAPIALEHALWRVRHWVGGLSGSKHRRAT